MGRGSLNRWVVAALAAAALGSTTAAAATSLGALTSAHLAAGSAPVESCDPDGITLSYDVKLGNVLAVVITGLHDACNGQPLDLLLVDDTDAIIASGSVSVTGGHLTVPVTPNPAAADVEGEHIRIQEP